MGNKKQIAEGASRFNLLEQVARLDNEKSEAIKQLQELTFYRDFVNANGFPHKGILARVKAVDDLYADGKTPDAKSLNTAKKKLVDDCMEWVHAWIEHTTPKTEAAPEVPEVAQPAEQEEKPAKGPGLRVVKDEGTGE